MMEGACHCGAVRMTVAHKPASLTECNCSICRRTGALWAYYKTAQVEVKANVDTQTYVWGDKMIAFHRCPNCGCLTHYTGIGEDAGDRVGVNARMLPLTAEAPVTVNRFDGGGSWSSLGEHGSWPWPGA